MSSLDFIAHLSKHLFWDVDKNDIDIEKHSIYIIQRVLEYGVLDDWWFIKDYYGLDKIVEDCKKMRTLDPKALSFICAISGTKKEDYRCYIMRQYTNRQMFIDDSWEDIKNEIKDEVKGFQNKHF